MNRFAYLLKKRRSVMFSMAKQVFLMVIWLEVNSFFCLVSALKNNSIPLGNTTEESFVETNNYTISPFIKSDRDRRDLSCNFAPGLLPGNQKRVLKCCKRTVSQYERYWAGRSLPLNRYLATLKEWNCPQFQQECKRKLFAFNEFTKLMYDYFCNYTLFVNECIKNVSDIIEILRKHSKQKNLLDLDSKMNGATLLSRWKILLSYIYPSQMSIDDLLNPCVQVAQLDKEKESTDGFQEIIDFGIPSCPVAWCGIGAEALKFHPISIWNCLSSGCRSRIITIMVFCGILAFAITLVNFLIIAVLSTNSNMQNSQSTYKLSLAVADLLVGLVVLPLAIDILRRLLWTRHTAEGSYTVKGYEMINGSLSEEISSVQIANRAGNLGAKFSEGYQNFAGFFVAVSISVSVYTLAAAGFDRLSAVQDPISYRKQRAHKIAKRVAIISWIFAIIFGCVPMFTPQLSYRLVLSITFATFDFNGLVLYSVGLLIPLLIVWAINIATYAFSKKHSKFRRQLTLDAQKKGQLIERRLASTLRLMVGVFTVNTLPLLLLIVSSIFISTISPQYPRSFRENNAVLFVTFEFVAVMLLFGNSLFNFFIYNIKNRDFRVALVVRFARLMKVLGCSACYDATLICYRRFVFSGRRRLSSFQSFSRQSFKSRKKSTNASTKVTSVIQIEENGSDGSNTPQNGAYDSVFIAGVESVRIEPVAHNEISLTSAKLSTSACDKQDANIPADITTLDVKRFWQSMENQKIEKNSK